MVMDAGMPAVVASGSNDGFGGSGIWAIVLVALFACGGFGRRDSNESNAEINGRFNSLENQIDSVNEMAQLRDNYKESCDTNMNVTQQAFDLSKEIMQNRFDTAIEFKNAELRAADCCCATNRNIDSLRFEGEKNTQKIIDFMQADKIEALRDKVAALELKESQIAQNTYLINQLTPRAIPAYPACNPNIPVQANFAGYGCGCGGYGYGI